MIWFGFAINFTLSMLALVFCSRPRRVPLLRISV